MPAGLCSPFVMSIAFNLHGFDLAVVRAYVADRHRGLEIVRFRWPELLSDLAADRFDVAMSGITIRPERSIAGIFTVPVVASGAVVLAREEAQAANAAILELYGVGRDRNR